MSNVIELNPAEKRRPIHPIARLALEHDPEFREAPPFAGISFDEWAQANCDRIWAALKRADRRDMTFYEFARELWARSN